MPTFVLNGKTIDFKPGEKIIQAANRAGVEIPQYCYHDALSIPAQCRICLAEIWAPNPRNDNKLEPQMGGKLQPTCSTPASEGMVVYTNSPRAVANQKAVMEFLLINHPLDCPVCDQAGECTLQDFSYRYGRGASRFEENKVKQPKKNLGPNVYIYSDRCIMCTRCVRFAREVPETAELMIDGRGNQSQIDVFPGDALDNEIASNVIDLCPVGALLDKDFLFTQRVWFLKRTAAVDPLTASGDNLWVEHNQGKIYRLKPRTNLAVNKWWITDEVRYGWKFVHSDDRIGGPLRRQYGTLVEAEWVRAYEQALSALQPRSHGENKRLAALISPMLTCEEAYQLATLAREIDEKAILAVGPVPFEGEDKHFPPSLDRDDPDFEKKAYIKYAEKAPNARGVRRVIEAVTGQKALEAADLQGGKMSEVGAIIVTGNYPSAWATDELLGALESPYVVLIDTLESRLHEVADVVLPGATFAEKAGTFENARGLLQAFEQSIPCQGSSKSEGQIATDMLALLAGLELEVPPLTAADFVVDEGPGQVPNATDSAALPRASLFNAGTLRGEMAGAHEALKVFATEVAMPPAAEKRELDMAVVEL
ncbi:MAG: molybdopterin-dependent oxidoreductase [Phycisphaeraceae bacterium]|nr:MAG: molybdopterin-dependent oxidoreductase [Phycisphaeraceae bacterium]